MRLPKLLPWLLVGGWSLLSVAWVMTSAPFGAPDEGDHYGRAIGIAGGALIGTKPAPPGDIDTPSGKWWYQTARTVTIPASKGPPQAACYTGSRDVSAACLDAQPPPAPVKSELTIGVGGYQPLPYLLPAAAMKLDGGPTGTLRLGRFAGLLLVLLMLAAAVAVLRAPDDDPLALLGVMLAVTPMVIYVASSLTGSGLEVAAGIAFVAALLRLSRSDRSPNHVWVIAGVSGSVLALSRSVGPLWVLLALVLAILVCGPRQSWSIARGGGRVALVAAVGIFVAVLLSRAWEAAYGIQHLPIGFENKRQALKDSNLVLRGLAPDFIGKFGYLEFQVPRAMADVWFVGTALLAVAALVVARWRERLVLVAAVLGAALVPMVFYIAIFRHTGKFGLQARHVLAVVVVVPVLAGELLYRGRKLLPWLARLSLVVVVPVVVAVVQLDAWWTAARRYAVGLHGPVNFLGDPQWSPPLGWAPWLALACLASALFVAVSVVAIRQTTLRSSG